MALALTYRRRLREVAAERYGYVTTSDAGLMGIPAVELRKLAKRGGIEHVAHGLYRFEDVPPTGRDQFMEAVLRAGPGAYLTGDAVLAFHDLGDVNPRRVRVGVGKRPRRALPEFVEIADWSVGERERTLYEGVPSATVARALLDCRGTVMGDRLRDAAAQAVARGLVGRRQAVDVLDALQAPGL